MNVLLEVIHQVSYFVMRVSYFTPPPNTPNTPRIIPLIHMVNVHVIYY